LCIATNFNRRASRRNTCNDSCAAARPPVRESLDFAERWTTPDTATPTDKAMKMYRNYDGSRSTFGDTGVTASSSVDADNLSVFAARSGIQQRRGFWLLEQRDRTSEIETISGTA
jgi:hypothetical protein